MTIVLEMKRAKGSDSGHVTSTGNSMSITPISQQKAESRVLPSKATVLATCTLLLFLFQ